MAVISCPQCSKKISDKVKQCPYCHTNMDMDGEARQSMERRRIAKKVQHISTQSMVAMVFFLGGFWVMYFQSPESDSPQMLVAQLSIAVGFVWYIINRIRLLILKRGDK